MGYQRLYSDKMQLKYKTTNNTGSKWKKYFEWNISEKLLNKVMGQILTPPPLFFGTDSIIIFVLISHQNI
jgi:hypothetical protein